MQTRTAFLLVLIVATIQISCSRVTLNHPDTIVIGQKLLKTPLWQIQYMLLYRCINNSQKSFNLEMISCFRLNKYESFFLRTLKSLLRHTSKFVTDKKYNGGRPKFVHLNP